MILCVHVCIRACLAGDLSQPWHKNNSSLQVFVINYVGRVDNGCFISQYVHSHVSDYPSLYLCTNTFQTTRLCTRTTHAQIPCRRCHGRHIRRYVVGSHGRQIPYRRCHGRHIPYRRCHGRHIPYRRCHGRQIPCRRDDTYHIVGVTDDTYHIVGVTDDKYHVVGVTDEERSSWKRHRLSPNVVGVWLSLSVDVQLLLP